MKTQLKNMAKTKMIALRPGKCTLFMNTHFCDRFVFLLITRLQQKNAFKTIA